MKILLSLLILLNISFTQIAFGFETKARQAFLIDYDTNEVLVDKNSHEKMPPSSMSKLMTILIILEKLEKNELSLSDKFTVSEKAWRKQGSKMFVKVKDEVSVEDLLKGILVPSGNDACIVIAEGLAGTEEAFALLMTQKGKEIGLKDSNFTNSTGWPDPDHYMSSRDLAILAKYLINHYPTFYHYFAMQEFTYNNIRQGNRNVLLNQSSLGVDGLKTGNTDLGGYGIVASAKLDGRRLILVINGLDSMSSRADEARRLLTYGFSNFTNVTLFKKGEVIENAKVWLGEKDIIPIVASEDIIITVPKHQEKLINVKLKYNSPIKTPIQLKSHIADLQVFVGEHHIKDLKILSEEEIKKLPFFKGVIKKLKYLIVDI